MGVKRLRIRRGIRERRILVRIEGEFECHNCFGHVARHLALSLIGRPEIELKLLLNGSKEFRLADDIRWKVLVPFIDPDPEAEVDVHIRHCWPPTLEPPSSGRWVIGQPLEFGNFPESWISKFRDDVDDVWCFTRHVRLALERAGFASDRLSIVHLGVDPDVFRPDIEPLPLSSERKFKFLFMGGSLERDGGDLLLDAYLKTFSLRDDVLLVVNDMDAQASGKIFQGEFVKASRDKTRPEIICINRHLNDEDRASIYKACDVFVSPYRGEGFALSVLEAMACGLHVIATSGGATDDFLNGSYGSRIVSDREESDNLIFYREPDPEELRRTLLWAYKNPEEGKRLGLAASRWARLEWTWGHAGDTVFQRLLKLSERPIRRFSSRPHSLSSKDFITDTDNAIAPDLGNQKQLEALEIAILKGEIESQLGFLEALASSDALHPQAQALLVLAERSISSEKSFVIKDIPKEKKDLLLRMIRGAIERTLDPMHKAKEAIKPKVSLTMIVRNEEDNIADCLNSICKIVDEIIVVDTGSKDRTKVIASALGAKVFDFPWVDSFARARNEAINHATGDWIFWLDADDRVSPENGLKLRAIFASLPNNQIMGYSMKVECVAELGSSPTVVDHVRLFPRHSALRWEYRVHENILPSINRMEGRIEWTNVIIHHLGYLNRTMRNKKHLRDHRLLVMNLKECPDDPFIHFNLGHSLIEVGDLEGASRHLRESISRSEPHYSQVKKAYVLLSQVERHRGDLEAALMVVEEGRVYHPKNPELLFFCGTYLQELRRFEEATQCFQILLETHSWPQEFGSFDMGILGHKSKHQLARSYLGMNKFKEAEELLFELRERHPNYHPASIDLIHLFIEAGRFGDARLLLSDLSKAGHGTETYFLEGALDEKEGRLVEAIRAYEKALEFEPSHEDSLRALSQVYLKLKDDVNAEKYFRKSVEGNPRSPQAWYNLAIFLLGKGSLEEALQAVEGSISIRPQYGMSLGLKDEIRRRLNRSGIPSPAVFTGGIEVIHDPANEVDERKDGDDGRLL